VAGAIVQYGSSMLTEPTGRDGRGTFAAAKASLVGAPGLQVVPAVSSAPAAGTLAEPLVFALQPDNELILRLRTPDGGVPAATCVQLRGAVELFAGDRTQGKLDKHFGSDEADCTRMGRSRPDGTTDWYESTARMHAGRSGVVTLHSLTAGAVGDVTVQDGLGAVLVTKQIALPQPGERLEVELVVTMVPRRIRGRVLDGDGAPLPYVGIKLQAGERTAYASTGKDGTFAFADIYSDAPVQLTASQNGFAAEAMHDIGRDRDGQPIEFRLQRGRPVRITARDALQQLVPVRIEVDSGAATPPPPQELAAGDYQFADLPPGTVTFHCQLGGQRFELQHDTGNPDAVLRVPTPARAVIVAPVGWPEPEKGFYLVAMATRLDAVGEPFELRLGEDDKHPQLLLPGRYRIALVAQRWQDDKPERRPLGPAAEVELRASETARVLLH